MDVSRIYGSVARPIRLSGNKPPAHKVDGDAVDKTVAAGIYGGIGAVAGGIVGATLGAVGGSYLFSTMGAGVGAILGGITGAVICGTIGAIYAVNHA